jgi:4-amino-4-deoxy-L-arabinose transferase-like glycosyltransferase
VIRSDRGVARDDAGTRTEACRLGALSASALLATILALAIVVRAWRLGWGLDHQLAFPDELAVWRGFLFAFSPPRWEELLGQPVTYPPLYGYLAGLAVAAAGALGLIGAERDVFEALLVARAVSVVAGTATVLLVYGLAARAYGRVAGIVAAALVASFPREATQTHYASVDVLLGTTAALTMLASCAFTVRRTAWLAFACGSAVALACGAKYNGLVLGAAPGWVLLEVALGERAPRRALALGLAFAGGLCLTLLVSCPPCFLDTGRIVAKLRELNAIAGSPAWQPPNSHLAATLGWYGRPYLYQLVAALPFALGWPAYLLSLFGVGVALWRRTPVDRVLLVALAAWLFFLGRTHVTFVRYLIPLFPALAVLAARGLLVLRLPRPVTAAIAAAVVAYGFALGFSQVDRFSYDQQLEVARWIAARFPEDARPSLRVVMPRESAAWLQLHRPLERVGVEVATAGPGKWLADRPDVFVLPEWYATSVRRDDRRARFRTQLDQLEAGALGYREAARFESRYFQQDLYTRLDPAFASELSMGAVGFRIYLRDDLVTPAPAPGAGPP